MTIETIDVAEEAVSLLLAQFKEKQKIVALTQAFISPMQDGDDDLIAMLTGRIDIETVVGTNLTNLAKMMGISRGGADDTELRALVHAQVQMNSSDGSRRALIEVTEEELNFVEWPEHPGEVDAFSKTDMTGPRAAELRRRLQVAKSAGIRIVITYTTQAEKAFAFDGAGGASFDSTDWLFKTTSLSTS